MRQRDELQRFTLAYHDVIRILDDAKANKVFLIPLTGGEPLLHPEILEIVSQIRQRKMLPLIGSSGFDIDHGMWKRLKDAGAVNVQLSIESTRQDRQDAYRAAGYFKQLLENIEEIKKVGMVLNLAITLDSTNLTEVQDLLDFCRRMRIDNVKVDFFENFVTLGDSRVVPLDKRKAVAKLCESYARSHSGKEDWICCMDGDASNSTSRESPLHVYANGDIRLGFPGKTLGNIKEMLPSEALRCWRRK
jgi:MoaA/NifB/PqqE/SkfB family radical SAM enzyme